MTSHKRKPDYRSVDDHPYKRKRSENGPSSNGGLSQDLPPLPPITSKLEKAVFTHASVAAQSTDGNVMTNYERLEFLGDAHLELMASQVIFERYKASTPGKMSSIREVLVRNDTIAAFTRAYEFDKRLRIATGHEQQREWTKIQGDVFEAYVCAVVLSDSDHHVGFDTAKAWVTRLWEPILKNYGMEAAVPDVKSKEDLGKQVLVSGVKLSYLDEKPPIMNKTQGTQTYFIGVYMKGWGYENLHLGSGSGDSKNAAGQQAARMALRNPKLEEIKGKRREFLENRDKEAQEKVKAGDVQVKPGNRN